MTLVIGVVCEARADQQTACEIADRVTCDEVAWIELDVLDSYRTWRGYDNGTPFMLWSRVKEIARTHRIKPPHGRFQGEPGAPDAAAARRAIRVMETIDPPIDAIVLVRDSDGQNEREKGLDQARQASGFHGAILVGVAHPKREAWVLAGFEPRNSTERRALAHVTDEVGFAPVTASHLLDAKHDHDTKNAKRVLALLCPSWERQRLCWQETDLDVLSRHGEGNGLAGFISEVKSRLLPRFGKAR